jgi:hypothetical protein
MTLGYSKPVILCAVLICLLITRINLSATQEVDNELDLKSIPIAEWLAAGEAVQIPWKLQVSNPVLRMDQRLQVFYTATIQAKDLNRSGNSHELFLISRISSPDGEWLHAPETLRLTVDEELAKGLQVRFGMPVFVKPGDYVLWLILYDRKTGLHNLSRRRVRVSALRNDPLPFAYDSVPLVEFPVIDEEENSEVLGVSSELSLPVANKRPLDIEVISTLSPPEQWTGRARILRLHKDSIEGALAALSQVELADGSISITGLDLLRREVLLEQRNIHALDWPALKEAFRKADSSSISVQALEGRKENGTFFRDFMKQRLVESSAVTPLRIFIVVTGSVLFSPGSDLEPLQMEEKCNCKVYHLRFRFAPDDVFDHLRGLIKPLQPKTFNLSNPRDLREAIADILGELQQL